MSEPTPAKPGGLWARLFSMGHAEEETPQDKEASAVSEEPSNPTADVSPQAAQPEPVALLENLPVPEAPPAEAFPVVDVPAPPPPLQARPLRCPCCQAVLQGPATFCDDCGYMFPANLAAATAGVDGSSPSSPTPFMASPSNTRVSDRYELQDLIGERLGIRRYRGLDLAGGKAIAVTIVAAALPEVALADDVPLVAVEDDDIMPGFDDVPTASVTDASGWPGVAWEKNLLEKANHPGLPRVLDHFIDNNTEYLIEEVPEGRTLWDAWDDTDAGADVRYGYLQQLAEALHALHRAGAILEGVRPDIVTVTALGQATINDVADLLPLPLPANVPIRASLYTAPELILNPAQADARADLYSLGATLYSLEYLHHGLEEKDFERQFTPRQVTDRHPDVHPLFPRLINKTFVRDVLARFPSDEMTKVDPSGFQELINTLGVCRRTLDKIRLDVAAWTTTGMVRTGNEDAFAFLHGVEGRQDDVYEYALVLLADGMGGYEAGEIAAAMAIAELRKFLLAQPLCGGLAGKDTPAPTTSDQVPDAKKVMLAALRHANKEVFTASRTPGKGKRGMGCTAEAVFIDATNVIVGHVGDSRTYHLHQGRLIQLTRDQTVVNRLVELGRLTPEEAENHENKNQLQQAIGGQSDVEPGVYHGRLKRGDWVLVCSDGLSNHISNAELEKMLTREAAGSAEEAARRLLNLVNLRGATDNATIVVVRAT